MVFLDRIYTKGGDAGLTSLGDGRRVPKTHPRIVAYGTVDDCIGYVNRLIEAGADEAITLYRYAELMEDADEYDVAQEYWEKAIEADPLEQGDTGLPLEPLDLLADRAGREPQRRGGGADRAVLGDGTEGGEGIEVEHGPIVADRAASLHDGG